MRVVSPFCVSHFFLQALSGQPWLVTLELSPMTCYSGGWGHPRGFSTHPQVPFVYGMRSDS